MITVLQKCILNCDVGDDTFMFPLSINAYRLAV